MTLLSPIPARRSTLSIFKSAFYSFPLLPVLYVRRIARSILGWIFAILMLIEGIFLAEKLTAILRSAIDRHAQLRDVLLALVCTAPEIFDLAVPIAVMFGVYRVMLRCREDREFLVIAGTGNGFRQLLWMIVGVAFAAQIVSLVASGVIEPLARFAGRAVLFNAEYRALRGGNSVGQFYQFPGHTVFVGTRSAATGRRWLFVREKASGDTDRVITADRADLEGPNAKGFLALRLGDFTSYDFASRRPDAGTDRFVVRRSVGPPTGTFCVDCEPPASAAPLLTLRANSFAQGIALNDILPFNPRGKSNGENEVADRGAAADEWTLLELLGLTTRPSAAGTNEINALGRRAARSLLCLVAPLIALIALAHTTRATQAFAVPVACVSLLCVDLAGTATAKLMAPAGPAALLGVLFGWTFVLIAVCLRAILYSQRSLVKPGLARA